MIDVVQSLNKGRGSNPGDTVTYKRAMIYSYSRSTKAGGRTPATRTLKSLT